VLVCQLLHDAILHLLPPLPLRVSCLLGALQRLRMLMLLCRQLLLAAVVHALELLPVLLAQGAERRCALLLRLLLCGCLCLVKPVSGVAGKCGSRH
jgi:hypothetical protein